ncbi:hypothetical protein DPMN_121184 [Dreissena polymorpha]|uniref:Uncharacterized protein n=1 Tax=Dreissena polymorpha TaxID=45954 RepID=A0A9D4GQ13_DREPO|nr:hypothetical protein DPMN_121184 [Dreissena polymorpha]
MRSRSPICLKRYSLNRRGNEKWNQRLSRKTKTEKEKYLKRKKNEAGLQEYMHAANNLFKEAYDRLASAIKKKDFKEIDISHALLDVARTKIDKATNALETCRSQRNEIESK